MAEQASEAKSTEEQQDERVEPTVVIITGMSGAGSGPCFRGSWILLHR